MRIIEPSYEIMTPIDADAIMKLIELCGRVCYKSEDKATQESAPVFISNIIKHGHTAVIEHYSLTVKFVCDRGVSHEIVRHRLASYCQESTRYCNYSKGKFKGEITVIDPYFLEGNSYQYWLDACRAAEKAYFAMINDGCTPQEARTVLPNSLKTEVVMTADLREWRHFLMLRADKAAHPQMRQLAVPLLLELCEKVPVFFDDVRQALDL